MLTVLPGCKQHAASNGCCMLAVLPVCKQHPTDAACLQFRNSNSMLAVPEQQQHACSSAGTDAACLQFRNSNSNSMFCRYEACNVVVASVAYVASVAARSAGLQAASNGRTCRASNVVLPVCNVVLPFRQNGTTTEKSKQIYVNG
jgi:hypothetical protein